MSPLQIIKNNIPDKLQPTKSMYQKRGELAIKRVMESARSEIVGRTPVKTGRLKSSIGRNQAEGVMNVQTSDNEIVGTMGTLVPYARHVEFGTSKMKARYYFTQGLEAAKKTALQIISNTMQGKT